MKYRKDNFSSIQQKWNVGIERLIKKQNNIKKFTLKEFPIFIHLREVQLMS